MHKPNGLVTMLTDFGIESFYPNAMKGRIFHIGAFRKTHLLLRVCDIAHNVPSQNLEAGAWSLKRTVMRFPPGTTHIAAVGTKQSPSSKGQTPGSLNCIIIRTHRFWLVGLDSGVLAPAAEETVIEKIYAVNTDIFKNHKTTTLTPPTHADTALHVLAPVAALLACGESPENLGVEVNHWSQFPLSEQTMLKGNVLHGEVVYFDRYGNAETNIMAEQIDRKGKIRIVLGDLDGVMHMTKLKNKENALGGWINSKGMLELFLTNLSLQEKRQLQTGTKVQVHFFS